MYILSIFSSLSIVSYLFLLPIVNLFTIDDKDERVSNVIWTVVGISLVLILSKFVPGGTIELMLLSGLFGAVFAFYKISYLVPKDESIIVTDRSNRILYPILSGIFAISSLILVTNIVSNLQNKIFAMIMFLLFLLFSGWLAYRIRLLSLEFKTFSCALLILSIPLIYKTLADYVHFLIHEIIHLNYVTFMFPDHPFLEPMFYQAAMNTVYNPTVTGFASMTFIMFLAIFVLIKLYWQKFIFTEQINFSQIEKRKTLALLRKHWRMKLIMILIIGILMFNSAVLRFESEEGIASEYFPVQVQKDYITISTSKPLYQISEGVMKKYRYNWKGKSIKFIVFRWQGNLKTVMDFCEFCKGETEGYYLKNNQLICAICQTPISPETIGTPGGCNPVPLKTSVSKFTVRIKESDLIKTFILKRSKK